MNPLSRESYMVFHPSEDAIVNSQPGLVLSCQPGHVISSYRELLKKVAALSYYNSRFRILFRGQADDYGMNAGNESFGRSSLYPSILRSPYPKNRADELDRRFSALFVAEEELKIKFRRADIYHDRLVRWAILQHYEVVPTPLLDLTHSLQTALSFALIDGKDEGYVFVLAFPHMTAPVSVSIESKTQVVDLTQVCPPDALRPHFQSGLVAADYPIVDRRQSSHGGRGNVGNNFACRLLTKFHLRDCLAWSREGFTVTPRELLFPDSEDPWFEKLSQIKQHLSDSVAGDHGLDHALQTTNKSSRGPSKVATGDFT